MVFDSTAFMSKFVSGASKDVVKEYKTAIFVMDMDISMPMVHALQIEENVVKEKKRDDKRSIICSFNFSQ